MTEQPRYTPRPLATKLARVLADVRRVPKTGRNDFHKYDYATESDLVDHLRDKLAEQGVAIFPSVTDHTVAPLEGGRGELLATVTLDITIIDGESGDEMTTRWVGQGMDKGDKSYYKAYTGAMKYFLMKTFMISTGDDPEDDREQPQQKQRQQSPKREERREQPQTKPKPKQDDTDAGGRARRRLFAVINEVSGGDKALAGKISDLIKQEEGVESSNDLSIGQLTKWADIITPDWLKRAGVV